MRFLNIYPNDRTLYIYDNEEQANRNLCASIQSSRETTEATLQQICIAFGSYTIWNRIDGEHERIHSPTSLYHPLRAEVDRPVLNRVLNIYHGDRDVVIHESMEMAMACGNSYRGMLGVTTQDSDGELMVAFPGYFISYHDGTRIQERGAVQLTSPVATSAQPVKMWLNIYPGKKNMVYIHGSRNNAIEQGDTVLGSIGVEFEGTLEAVRRQYPTMKVMSHILGKTFEPFEEPYGC